MERERKRERQRYVSSIKCILLEIYLLMKLFHEFNINLTQPVCKCTYHILHTSHNTHITLTTSYIAHHKYMYLTISTSHTTHLTLSTSLITHVQNSPVSIGRDEVQTTMNTIILCNPSTNSTLIINIFLVFSINVIQYRTPAVCKIDTYD